MLLDVKPPEIPHYTGKHENQRDFWFHNLQRKRKKRLNMLPLSHRTMFRGA